MVLEGVAEALTSELSSPLATMTIEDCKAAIVASSLEIFSGKILRTHETKRVSIMKGCWYTEGERERPEDLVTIKSPACLFWE